MRTVLVLVAVAGSMIGQDLNPDRINVVQEREAHERAVAERIEHHRASILHNGNLGIFDAEQLHGRRRCFCQCRHVHNASRGIHRFVARKNGHR